MAQLFSVEDRIFALACFDDENLLRVLERKSRPDWKWILSKSHPILHGGFGRGPDILRVTSEIQIETLTFEGNLPDAKEPYPEVNYPGFRGQANRFLYWVPKPGGYGGLGMAERHWVTPWVWELTEWVLPPSAWAPSEFLRLKDLSDLERLDFEGDLELCERDLEAET